METTPNSDTAASVSLSSTLAAIDQVEGWLTRAQATRLWRAAGQVPAAGQIVEIGSFRGRSTTVLGLGSLPDVHVFAVDPFLGSDRGPQEIAEDRDRGKADMALFTDQISRADLSQRVTLVRELSGAAAALSGVTGRVDLLYIDGAHRYAPARDDIAHWGARVNNDGGVMLIHDAFSSIGVTLASMRLLFASSRWLYVGRDGSLAQYRAAALSNGQRASNAARQALQLGWFARNLVIKLLITAKLGRLTRLFGHDGSWPY